MSEITVTVNATVTTGIDDRGFEYTEYTFATTELGPIPPIRITSISLTATEVYEISSPAFRIFNSFQIEKNFTGEFILSPGVPVPTNTPVPTIILPHDPLPYTITFILTSNKDKPLKYQIQYVLQITPDPEGTATAFINAQSTHTDNTNSATNTTNMTNSMIQQINKHTMEPISIIPAPRVIITALNTTNGLEVAEISVQVIDTITYTLCNGQLTQRPGYATTTSLLEIYHTEFSTVVLGCGCTFVDKLINLVGPDYTVYTPILVYAILKYVLALLIYGELNLKYLYRSFNQQFLRDLQESRFTNFYEVFTVPNPPLYNFTETDQYFIWAAKGEDNCKPCCGATNNIENKKPLHRIWNEDIPAYNQKPVHRIWNQ